MSLSVREQRQLRRIAEAVRRSDPHLVSMLAIFGSLTAGEPVPGYEQPRTLGRRMLAAALLTAATAAALFTSAACVCTRTVAARAPRGWIMARRLGPGPRRPARWG